MLDILCVRSSYTFIYIYIYILYSSVLICSSMMQFVPSHRSFHHSRMCCPASFFSRNYSQDPAKGYRLESKVTDFFLGGLENKKLQYR